MRVMEDCIIYFCPCSLNPYFRRATFSCSYFDVFVSHTFNLKNIHFFLRFIAIGVFLSVFCLSIKVWRTVIEAEESELVASFTPSTEKKMARETNCDFFILVCQMKRTSPLKS